MGHASVWEFMCMVCEVVGFGGLLFKAVVYGNCIEGLVSESVQDAGLLVMLELKAFFFVVRV
jgi:hypothetical protein